MNSILKKVALISLTAVLCVASLTGCKNNSDDGETATEAPSATESTEEQTETEEETQDAYPQKGFDAEPYGNYEDVRFELTASAESCKAGDTITFTAKLTGVGDFKSLQFVPIYNVNIFEAVTDEYNCLIGGFSIKKSDGTESKYIIGTTEYDSTVDSYNSVAAWEDTQNYDGDYFTFSLKLKEDVTLEEAASEVSLFCKVMNLNDVPFKGKQTVNIEIVK